MSYAPNRDFLIEVAKGNVAGHSLVRKFGFNDSVNSTLAPITDGAVYQTPTSAISLELVSSDANDTAAGTGARSVYIEGLDASFALQTETVSMAGTGAAALANSYTRIFRMYVATSGTYATSSTASHAGTITLRVSGGGATWATIGTSAGGFPLGQTEIGCYTIPAGKTAYLLSFSTEIESTKTPNVLWFQRQNADDVSAPVDAMRIFHRTNVVAGGDEHVYPSGFFSFPAKTDMGAMGYVGTGTAAVSVNFELLLVDN